MSGLGPRQLALLRVLCGPVAMIGTNKTAAGLVSRGMLVTSPPGSFTHITPAGLRAVADAAEAGRIVLFTPPSKEGGA